MIKQARKRTSPVPAVTGGTAQFDETIPITRPTPPSVKGLLKEYETVLRGGMLTNAKNVREFEARAAAYLGVRNAVALSSCTSGLMLTMKVLKLRGEVILPSFTFHATAHAVVWNGLTPVFVDCDPGTCNIAPAAVERAITGKTCAILAVHMFGNPADTDALQKIADRHGLALIFDAAHAFGARRRGKSVGSFGTAESFSLSPTKLLTTGEGGIVSTQDDALAAQLRVARNYGDSGDYDCAFAGFNARMSESNAMLGNATIRSLETYVSHRQDMAELYKACLAGIPGLTFQTIDKRDRSTFKDFSIMVDEKKFGLTRDELSAALAAENIVTKKYFYPPVHWQKAYAAFSPGDDTLPHTVLVTCRSLSLPMYSHIPASTVKGVCAAVRKIFDHAAGVAQRLRQK